MFHDRLLARLSKFMPSGQRAPHAHNDQPSLYEQLRAEADAGDPVACFRLGHIHEIGWLGRRPEPPVAYRYYMLVAIDEHAEAQYRLGLMARDGSVEQPDGVKAWMWLSLAVKNGCAEAAAARDTVAAAFTPRERVAAEAMLAHWPRIKASNGQLIHFYRGLVQ